MTGGHDQELGRRERERLRAGRSDERLTNAAESRREELSPVGVELRQGVVEQQERGDPDLIGQDAGLGEEQREDCHSLLALRAERPKVTVSREDPDLVEVRPG